MAIQPAQSVGAAVLGTVTAQQGTPASLQATVTPAAAQTFVTSIVPFLEIVPVERIERVGQLY